MVISTRTVRVARELMKLNSVLEKEEGFNIVMNNNNNVEDINTPFEVQFKGPDGSPYDKMLLSLQISFPISYLFFVLMFRFPFEPPLINFISPIYHPNIDSDGRICLDILKLPPKGCWRPTCSLLHLLHSIKILLLEPNPDDPLVNEIVFLNLNLIYRHKNIYLIGLYII